MKSKFLLCLFSVLIFQSALFAQTHIWTGNGGDNDWFNVANWDVATIPSVASDVVIPTGFLVEISTAPAEANSIALTGVTTLTIENNLTLVSLLTLPAASNINWLGGVINGGGTIDNDGLIQLESFEDKKLSNITLNNYGAIYITNSNLIRLEQGVVINNYENANIDILSNGGMVQDDLGNSLNNYGTINKLDDGSGGGGSFYMIYDMNNFGTLDIAEGHQYLFLVTSANLYNAETGVMQGSGAYDITATFTNDGTFSPAGSGTVGTMDVVNNFTFTANAKLEIDIAGANPGAYDVMEVFGFPDLGGSIQINLTYAPEIGDEYGIITANDITSCTLSDYVYATYEGLEYTFIVFCNSTNVTLRMVEINLATPDFASEKIEFYVQPNPVTDNSQFIFPSDVLQLYPEAYISILNSLGQEIERISTMSEYTPFNGSHLASGIYVARLYSGKTTLAISKFVKL
ncbi:MAG: T9SS type A sorting domain-containing protein [Altibacter sp.]|uniref:T9SS type A sorting domain-containing protein n=1 Tax=Altibacter sp. TaxID=2024823 RepID=UPI001D9ABC78|nr:T9SS type A sorting domain-containing protein [Altibacter sp.]MBZ0326741.1 T9SS type A sorting domain-containing protein [Altibacter sp.]